MRHLILLAILFVGLPVYAQRHCATEEMWAQEVLQNPELAKARKAIDKHCEQYRRPEEILNIITIPVVFHIVHNGESVGLGTNISDAAIYAQLEQMNDDFSLMNTDANLIPAEFSGLASNTMIQFCLAQRSPDCLPTDGIHRYNGMQADWSRTQIQSTLKPATIWDRNQYLNIWTVKFAAVEGGLLGYAQFPGGGASTDGVVVLYSSVGSLDVPFGGSNFDRGRTMTHEVGHWLNLRHIWGDATCGDDQVADTPVHETDNGGCPAYPHVNTTCSPGNPYSEMTMNYMDYVDDLCMHMFSHGQGDRMYAVLDVGGPRESLAASEGCLAPTTSCLYCTASATQSGYEKISNVTFAGLNNSSSGTAGYQNFTSIIGNVAAGSSYPFSASISNGIPQDEILVWIDLNGDGDFDDSGEKVFDSPNGAGPHTTNITIPGTATQGSTRMRVRLHDTSDGANNAPCGTSTWGQVEDYTLEISAPLPVELTRFEARKVDENSAELSWQTANELKNKGFEVEMSTNTAANFVNAGFVAAQNSGRYQFSVNQLQQGNTYYFRLRQVDLDGQFEYSPVRALEFKRNSLLQVSPNPARNEFVCTIKYTNEATAFLSLLDATGRVVKSQQVQDTQTSIQIAELPTGIYTLKVQSGNTVESVRLIIQ